MSRSIKSSQRGKPRSNKPNLIWPAAGAILLLIVIAGAIALQPRPALPAQASLPAEISIAQAAAKRDSGAFMLDVREPTEWNELHMPDATLIPLGDLENRLDEVPIDQEIIVVCRSGNRSATGRDILINAGFSEVTSMAGGIRAWSEAGYPTAIGP